MFCEGNNATCCMLNVITPEERPSTVTQNDMFVFTQMGSECSNLASILFTAATLQWTSVSAVWEVLEQSDCEKVSGCLVFKVCKGLLYLHIYTSMPYTYTTTAVVPSNRPYKGDLNSVTNSRTHIHSAYSLVDRFFIWIFFLGQHPSQPTLYNFQPLKGCCTQWMYTVDVHRVVPHVHLFKQV